VKEIIDVVLRQRRTGLIGDFDALSLLAATDARSESFDLERAGQARNSRRIDEIARLKAIQLRRS